MDPVVPASFIPKQTLEPVHASSMGLFFLVSLLLFLLSLVAAGGVFVYQSYLNSTIESKKSSLKNSEGAYDLPAIQELLRTDARINEAKSMLQKHTAPSAIFSLLAQLTLAQVQLTSLDYKALNDGSASIGVSGIGDTFATVALQSDQFGSSRVLHDVVFSGVTVNGDGKVTFNMVANVDASVFAYSKNLSGAIPITQGTTAATSSNQ